MRIFILTYIFIQSTCFAQPDSQRVNNPLFHSTYFANTLSTHPFGVFISRVNHNFQTKADKKMSFTLNASNGNVWLPFVKAYVPLLESDRDLMKSVVWHKREDYYDKDNTPSKIIEFEADGVIRTYQINYKLPISEKHEIKIGARMFSIDKGNAPYSVLTSDAFIESFHSNIAGGEDPFARKYYGLNKSNIYFNDGNGKTMQLRNRNFLFSGIDFLYAYYPNLEFLNKRNFYLNSSLQLGINTSKINQSMDLGLNFGVLKKIKLRNTKKELCLGVSAAALRQKMIFFEGVELSNKNFLLSSELFLEYIKHINEKSYLSIATTWYVQNSYRNKREYEYIVLTGERITSHWHYAISHLYRKQSAHNLVFTYGKNNVAVWLYLREDLLVDNAPDIQTGIGLRLLFI